MYGALLALGLALLGYTVARIVFGGIADADEHRAAPSRTVDSAARRILDQRYAAGDLSTDEYHHRRRVLEERQ